MPLVGVLMGSASDEPIMRETTAVLDQMGVSHEVEVMSAHRTPDKVRSYGLSARERGVEVIIAGAGGSAGLPGVLASWTTPGIRPLSSQRSSSAGGGAGAES